GLAPNQGTNDGVGSSARLFEPEGLVVDPAGNVYVADANNHTIREGLPDLGAPAIVVPPQSQVVTVGSNATVNVTAVGAYPLSYQWRKDGATLPGATTTTLTLNNVSFANAGGYDVVVANSFGSITSAPP